jgi:lipopolysaccharide/colanic/teichoic acid biosynthesis glycosyltransferase
MTTSERIGRLEREDASAAGAATPPVPGPGPAVSSAAAAFVPAFALPLADLVAIAAAACTTGRVSLPTVAYGVAVLAILAGGGLQRLRICGRVSDQIGGVLAATALPLPFLLGWLPAGLGWRLALSSAAGVIVLRVLTYSVLRAAHRRDLLTEPTLIVGAGDTGILIASLLGEHPELGLRPLGFLDACMPPDEGLPLPVLGVTADLPEMIKHVGAQRVIMCFPVDPDQDLVPVLRASRGLGADICLVPRLHELGIAVSRSHLDEVWGIPLLPLRRHGRVGLLLKRAFDLLATAVLLCLCAPVLLVLAAVLRLQSGRPAIFRQLRVTGEERIVPILKLRTLAEHGDSDTRWAVPVEGSTRLARWLRSSHLDELPKLVNVLRGEMSVVGPRPERPYFAERFGRELPGYQDRHRVPAGLTGWAQVNGLHGDTSLRDRVRFDNQYIEYRSPWLDVLILVRTLAAAVLPNPRCRR